MAVDQSKLALSRDIPVLSDEQLADLPADLAEAYLAAVGKELEQTQLTHPQMRAHELGLEIDEVMYGGAAGGGKSHLAVWHADYCSRRWDMHRTLCLRSSLPELRRTLITKTFELIDTKEAPGAAWKAAVKEWHYGNGSVIEFGYCKTIDDTRQFLSAEYDLIIIDESTDMSSDMIEMLRSRLRTTAKKKEAGVNPHLMMLTNPGGMSHAWHRDRFVLPSNHGEYVLDVDERDEKGRGRVRRLGFVPAKVDDNPFIDPDYVANLAALSDPVKRAQYLDGDWSIFEGQFFSDFDKKLHVIDPFEIPESWPRFGGYDWGFISPSCLLLGAVDPDRRVHVYREMYVDRLTAKQQGDLFVQWREKVDYIAADPSIWRNTGQGVPLSQQLMGAGMSPLTRAMNARVDGWNRVREHFAPDDLGLPGVYIHSTCTNLIRTLPELPRDENNPEDLNTRTEDHAADALRYMLATRPRRNVTKPTEPQTYDERVLAYVNKKAGARRTHTHDVLGRVR